MYSRAVSKLHLTNTVIEEGRFSLLDQAQSAAAGLQVWEQNHKAISMFFESTVLMSDKKPLQLSLLCFLFSTAKRDLEVWRR